jgi:hypothetical protein
MKRILTKFPKVTLFVVILLLIVSSLKAQFIPTVSGGWDGAKIQGAGFVDYGSGRVKLLDNVNNGCEGAAVFETTATYNPCSGNFNKCYQVVFGCDDAGADGLAFMFSTCSAITDYQVWGCGGGLGYIDACPGNKGIIIEFDTFNNGGVDDFDTGYEGTGTQDQIAIHKNMQAKTGPGKVTGVAVPNLEDGQEHKVCITYDNTTHVLAASIDGITRISYDMDLAGLEFQSYFGACTPINQSWSAGTNGAFNNQAVSNGASLYNAADKICPTMLPVEFLYIDAIAFSSQVLVSWATASETENKKFIIERSNDASSWETIGQVSGAGNSIVTKNYNYTDYAPLNGISYYRIQQIDLDGKSNYSKVVVVETNDHHVNVMPNPFNETLTISTDISGKMEITIQDVLGRSLYNVSKESENGMLNIMPELSAGVYIMTIKTDSFIEQREIVKK